MSPKPVNFQNIIIELEDRGISLYKMSLMLDRQIGKIMRWKSGQQPKHYEGEMLLSLHSEFVPRETTDENEPSQTHKIETEA